MSQIPPPGHYLASDGQVYPVPPGQYLASDGGLYPLPSDPPTTTAAWRWTRQALLLAGGSAGVIVGAFMPWVSVGPFTKTGIDGDGTITLILGAACVAFGLAGLRRTGRGFVITALVAAALCSVIAVIDIADVGSVEEGPLGLEATIGFGLVLTLLGGIAATAGAVGALRSARGGRSL